MELPVQMEDSDDPNSTSASIDSAVDMNQMVLHSDDPNFTLASIDSTGDMNQIFEVDVNDVASYVTLENELWNPINTFNETI